MEDDLIYKCKTTLNKGFGTALGNLVKYLKIRKGLFINRSVLGPSQIPTSSFIQKFVIDICHSWTYPTPSQVDDVIYEQPVPDIKVLITQIIPFCPAITHFITMMAIFFPILYQYQHYSE